MKNKTIMCEPKDFDIEFENWKKSLPSKLKAIEIFHENNNHYILYKLDYFMDDENDE